MKRKLILVVAAAMVLALSWSAVSMAAQPKNVILFIGDGMGPEQVKAGNYFNGGDLSFESFPYQGVITTHSANAGVTDSAAAGTALATGIKVNNGVISRAYPGDGSELETLLEYYADRDRSTGLVTTTYMTHATPAAFGAHESSRNNYSQIGSDYINQTRPNMLFGGGAHGLTGSPAGYSVVTDRAGLLGLDTEDPLLTHVSGQFGTDHLPYEYDGLGSLPHLWEMTATALNVLDNDPDGFFLMVEGGRIDHAGHSNHIERNVRETTAFSAAVQEAIDWAGSRTDTLIIVTADHETGGLTVLADNGAGNAPTVSWSTGSHTATNVPIYAWGLHANEVLPLMDNTDVFGVAISSAEAIPEPTTLALLGVCCLAMRTRSRLAR